ncbi:MAG: AraC family transcriptional regulator [Lachnospiraceae bacterium]|nr:AraC family transcriptional regulator [Lachnospiraceae bacterium]
MTTTYDIGSITDAHGIPLLKMWRVDIPAGKRILRQHHHLNFEIMRVNGGSGIYTTSSAKHPISAGDVFVFSSNEFHCITDVGKDGLQITNLHFDPVYLRSTPYHTNDSFSLRSLNFCFGHNPSFLSRIPAGNSMNLTGLLSNIEQELTNQKQEFALSVNSYLNLLLILLIRDFGYAEGNTGISHDQLQCIQQVLSYIDSHFAEKISLQELSLLAGLSPNYFCTLFKQVSGMTLWNYINAKRIEKAARLIIADGVHENMIDIAAECGYNNTANFNKVFKKVTGMTPREYRNSGQGLIS